MIGIKSQFKTTGLDAALVRLEQNVRAKVVVSGVAAMARVIYEEVRMNASGLQVHPQIKTGKLYESIYRAFSESRSNEERKTYHVSWNKTKAPHGHLIEFGTVKQPAYPFLRPAFDKVTYAISVGKQRMKERFEEVRSEV